jgi:uncharacterized ferritin-like protein (DUF455 family)
MTMLETPLDPTLFAEGPRRDARFDVRERWLDMENLPHDHPDVHLEFLARQMNEELNSMEIAAGNLVDFPDAPWALRMSIARQAADEARHAIAFRRLLEARGGSISQFPVINFQYRIMLAIPSLIGRLAVANRSFEASGIDAITDGLQSLNRKDDVEFTSLFDQQLADEVQHVRFANVWIKKLVDEEGPRTMMALARGVAQGDKAFKQIVGADNLITYPVSEDVRREAGFTEAEIQTAHSFVAQN